MWKWLLIIILIGIPFKSSANGMQGACSDHGDVSYSTSWNLSPTTDGNVYCTDGFHSSVLFVPPMPLCNTTCCNSNDLQAIQTKWAISGAVEYNPGAYKQEYNTCQQQINDYKGQLNSYIQELKSIQTASDSAFKQKLEANLNQVNQKAQEQKDEFAQQQLQNAQQKSEVNQIVANFFTSSTSVSINASIPSITGLQMPVIKKVTKKVQPKKIIIKKKKK